MDLGVPIIATLRTILESWQATAEGIGCGEGKEGIDEYEEVREDG